MRLALQYTTRDLQNNGRLWHADPALLDLLLETAKLICSCWNSDHEFLLAAVQKEKVVVGGGGWWTGMGNSTLNLEQPKWWS